MKKKNEKATFCDGDILTYEQVFDNDINIMTEEEYRKEIDKYNNKHKMFLDAEEWRKHITWKPISVKQLAMKIEDDKYMIKEIKIYSENIKDIEHCQQNLDNLFKYHPMLNTFRFEEYSKTKEFNGDKYDEDSTPAAIFNFFRRNFGEWCPRNDIKDTIQETIDNNRYNFFIDWIESHPWDGIERLDDFMCKYYNAEDNPLVRAYFSRWMIAEVKRAYEPGAKFDSMLILSSLIHGKKKTSLFEWLGTINGKKLYNDVPDDLKDLNSLVYASKGKAILLFDDFDDICDKGKLGKVKSFITQRARTAALKWQHDKDYPISYVLGGTTNNISILVDDGTFDERRFWIIEVNPTEDVFNLPEELKEQLYAEAAYRYKENKDQWLWIWEPELKQMEIEWQKKYKKANEDTMVETIVNIFNRKYPIDNGMFKNEKEFIHLIEEEEEECEFLYDKPLEYIKVIPAAWITKYLQSSARGTDRIVQILHTQGFNVKKRQRYWYEDKQLTCIIIYR